MRTPEHHQSELPLFTTAAAPERSAPPVPPVEAGPATPSARDLAKAFIRPYVLRGDSVDSLKGSLMGSASAAYWAQIGGSVFHPTGRERPIKLRPDEIAVTRIDNEACLHRFSLAELCAELTSDTLQPRLF